MPTRSLNQKIAFLTCKDLPNCTEDDLLAEAPLKQRGFDLIPVVWDETSVLELNRFAAVIMRSPWDYQHKKEKFLNFVKSLSSLQMPVLNSPELILWNMDKSYLFELQAKGIAIVPSKKILRNEGRDFWQKMLEKLPWEKIVIKPTVSASAYNTFLVDKADAIKRSQQWEGLSADNDFLVQEFCPSIQTEGEISLIYFNDRQKIAYSHAVIKKPKSNDFRVQEHLGGVTEAFLAPEDSIAFGAKVLTAISQPWLYARVDILKHPLNKNSEWVLGELEVLEPQLFMRFDGNSAQKFAEAIKANI